MWAIVYEDSSSYLLPYRSRKIAKVALDTCSGNLKGRIIRVLIKEVK